MVSRYDKLGFLTYNIHDILIIYLKVAYIKYDMKDFYKLVSVFIMVLQCLLCVKAYNRLVERNLQLHEISTEIP